MPNKKISQLSTISPVPTGGLMLVSNGGVSRSATVKDVAEAITDSVTTFTGMSDTPDAISGNMFVVGNPGGTELIFTKNLNLGTGTFVETSQTGDFIDTSDTGNFLFESSLSGTYSTQFDVTAGGGKYSLSEVTGASHAATTQVQQLQINLQRGNTYKFRTDSSTNGHPFIFVTQGGGGAYTYEYTSGVTNSRAQNGTSLYFRVPQAAPSHLFYACGSHSNMGARVNIYDNTGSLIDTSMTGSFLTSANTGILIGTNQTGDFLTSANTGILVGVNQTGDFVSTSITGNILVGKEETGVFPTGEGTSGYFAKWIESGVLTTGLVLEDSASIHPYIDKNLGKSNKRWGRLFCKTVDAVNDGFTFIESETTSATSRAVVRSVNSDGNYLNLRAASTGDSTLNIGSGHYAIYGTQSGKKMFIGNQQDINFHASSQSITSSGISFIAQFLKTGHIKLNEKVTFSDAYTFPTSDGSAKNFLATDGAGNISFSGAAGITGGLAASFIELDDTPSSLGSAGQVVAVTADGNSLTFSGISPAGGDAFTGNFLDSLTDTPSTYAGNAGSIVVVKTGVDGLEFKASGDFVGASETGNFVDTASTGILVGTNQTGEFVDKTTTGSLLVGINMTGNLVSTAMTGSLVSTSMTGNSLLGSDFSGTITSQVDSGIYSDYSAEYNVNINTSANAIEIIETSPLNSGQREVLTKPELVLHKGNTYKFNITGGTGVFFGISTGLNEYSNVALFNSGQDEVGVAKGITESYFFRVPQDAPKYLAYNAFSTRTPSIAGHGLNNMGNLIKTSDDAVKVVSGVHSGIHWDSGNIQYVTIGTGSSVPSSVDFLFHSVKEGETLKMYIQNKHTSEMNCNFVSGSPNQVFTPTTANGDNAFPTVGAGKTNFYEFTRIHTGIFVQYNTGYIY